MRKGSTATTCDNVKGINGTVFEYKLTKSNLHNMKILGADDQPIILKSLKHKLEEVGFEVFGAIDGQQAIDFFNAHKPDLAILDLNMPEKSGFEVIKHIRTIMKSEIPIIIMSGNDEEKTILEAFNLGADDYIEKPVGLNEVAVRVKRLLKMPILVGDNDSSKSSGILKKLSKRF